MRLSQASNNSSQKFQRTAVFLFFGTVLVLGLLLFKDYGMSVDERVDHLTGLVNTRYVLEKVAPGYVATHPGLNVLPKLATYPDRHYGPFFQLPAAIIPQLLGFTDSRDIFFTRHVLTFLFFFSGLVAFYAVLQQRFRNSWWALTGCLFLVLSPRIFAESFYNGKDIVFLAVMLWGWFSLSKFRQKLNVNWLFLHGLICGAVISTRILGLLLPALTFVWLAHLAFYSNSGAYRKKLVLLFTGYLTVTFLFTLAFWPYIWEAPLTNFLHVFSSLKRGGGSFDVLYFGQFIPFNNLPWHYIPVWLFITTPLIYSAWFVAGVTGLLLKFLRERIGLLHTENGQQDFTALLLFSLPIGVVVFTKAILYDGWRHLYFIYPAFLYLAVLGLQHSYHYFCSTQNFLKRLKWLIGGITIFGLLRTAVLMVQMHPFQHVYFSFLPAGYIEKNFDRDYWGLSYKKGLEYILETDTRPQINVATNFISGAIASDLLTPEQRQRLQFTELAEADYFLTEYRWHPQPYPYPREVFKIEAKGVKILSVFKLK